MELLLLIAVHCNQSTMRKTPQRDSLIIQPTTTCEWVSTHSRNLQSLDQYFTEYQYSHSQLWATWLSINHIPSAELLCWASIFTFPFSECERASEQSESRWCIGFIWKARSSDVAQARNSKLWLGACGWIKNGVKEMTGEQQLHWRKSTGKLHCY
jgi:hypothetical protein